MDDQWIGESDRCSESRASNPHNLAYGIHGIPTQDTNFMYVMLFYVRLWMEIYAIIIRSCSCMILLFPLYDQTI